MPFDLTPDGRASLESIVGQLEAAWNAMDGTAFAAPFADDADFVNIRGEHFRGRAAIAAGHVEIFRTIYNGKIEKEGNRWKMPAWRGKLSKEQIWALIYFVEFQSGGIEGRFPPSLYPRESAEHQ